nr:hypothetical protein OG409_10195 [Streptomyces sp. NBC_00974]
MAELDALPEDLTTISNRVFDWAESALARTHPDLFPSIVEE